jgi:hypothetical protein
MTGAKCVRTALALAASGLITTGCATASRFEWGGYEGALYTYAKKPDTRPEYRKALEQAIAQGRKANRLAPGLLAELGYLHLEDGDTAEALKLFEEEMRAFPESRPFLQGVIDRTNGATKTAEVAS